MFITSYKVNKMEKLHRFTAGNEASVQAVKVGMYSVIIFSACYELWSSIERYFKAFKSFDFTENLSVTSVYYFIFGALSLR
jgi:hypothetical protein